MNLKKYKEKLEAHDWHYRMSDDPRKYNRGLEQENELKALAVGKITYQKAYALKLKKVMKYGKNKVS